MGIDFVNHLKNKTLQINVILFLSFVLSFILRIIVIGEYGFTEDEVLKTIAYRDYRNLNFSTNAQHPALMKLIVTVSVILLGETEFAYRLPNVFIASLTIYPIFYLSRELFNEITGFFASFLWAVDIPSIAFTTVSKEDPLLTIFWILSVYYFIKSQKDQRYLRFSGICVGFAVASKYSALLLVLLLLILYYVNQQDSILPSIKKTARICIPPAMIIFFIFNFPILFPKTVKTLFDHYILHKRPYPPRTGRIMMGYIFKFRPLYWIILFIVVKIPISILVLLFIGTWFGIKYRLYSHKVLFLWVILPTVTFSITGGFTRYILVMIPAFLILSANGTLRFSDWVVSLFSKKDKKLNNKLSKGIAILIIFLTCLHSLFLGIQISPYYRMYVNEIGGGSDKAGYYFTQDSVYDYQLREAIFYVNNNAPENSTIAIQTPFVGVYYGREDLHFISVTELPVNIDLWSDYDISYAIIQESRLYFENEQQVENIRNTYSPIFVGKVLQVNVVEVYSILLP